ncbi:MAG: MGDG synthase family glycosyltransferase [Candidatus Aquicultorales bacterium]
MSNATVLLLTAEAGGGHKSVSLALTERFEKELPGHDLMVVNAYEELLEFPLSLINNAHRQIVRHSPVLWNVLFESTSAGRRFTKIENLTRPLTEDKVERLFDEIGPSVVVSVVPLVNALVGEVARRRGIPFIVVVTDMARVHPAWISEDESTIYCAPTRFVVEELINAGVPAGRVFFTGLPARGTFFTQSCDRQALRRKLGIRPGSFAILMMGGGEGVGLCGKTLRELQSMAHVELFIFAGRNKRLIRKLERRFGGLVNVLGFVDNVDEWLKASDLLVTKSGPSTLVEAAASRMPTLFMGALPGQEQSIIDALLLPSSEGEGLLCDSSDIATKVKELMASGRRRQELADSITQFALPGASRDVCHLIENLIAEEADAQLNYL